MTDDAFETIVRHKLDVVAYHRMAETGILGQDDRVELIGGELIVMSPIGLDHAASVDALTKRLVLASGDRAVVSVQNPILVDNLNEPQPDFVVSRPRADHRTRRTGPDDILLVVKVADSSLRFDRGVKRPLYARSGIAEFWIVDLHRRVVESHRKPVGGAYTETVTFGPEDTVALVLAPDILVPLTRVFD